MQSIVAVSLCSHYFYGITSRTTLLLTTEVEAFGTVFIGKFNSKMIVYIAK